MITLSQTEFPTGDILIQGLTDAAGATDILVGENKIPVTDGAFEFTIPSMAVGSYNIPLTALDADGLAIEEEPFTITIVETTPVDPATVTDPVPTDPVPVDPTPVVDPVPTDPTPTTPTVTDPVPVETTNEVNPMANSAQAQALVDLNQSTIQTYVPRYTVGHETDTSHVSIYPGSLTGFGPLSVSAHAATKADEFKIMSDAALAANPSAGFTGGRGTGNPAKFGRFPERALMTDVRGEFFPKAGDFNSKTLEQYPLGRTGDLLENQIIPVGFTQKDPATGYSTTTTRGGVNASPIPTSGFTF